LNLCYTFGNDTGNDTESVFRESTVQVNRPTIHDVAQQAEVKVSTVSRVLNGHPDVSKATRARVLETIDKLHYVPSRAARSFRTGRTQSVSIMLPMIGTEFYNRLIAAVDKALADHDYDAALFPMLNEKRLERYLKPNALPYQTDGMLFASLNPDWLFPQAKVPAPLPTVLIDAYHAAYDTVTVDNFGGAYKATRHLLERPAETFAIMVEERYDTPFASGVFLERLKGFRQACFDVGTSCAEQNTITVEFERESGQQALSDILKLAELPINVFASCDLLARGVLDEMNREGLTLGQDIGLVGFDDQPWAAAAGLTTVRQPIEELGKTAVELLLERLDNREREVRHIELKPSLIVRSSTSLAT
jgi:LacI family transcriptional regulator